MANYVGVHFILIVKPLAHDLSIEKRHCWWSLLPSASTECAGLGISWLDSSLCFHFSNCSTCRLLLFRTIATTSWQGVGLGYVYPFVELAFGILFLTNKVLLFVGDVTLVR